MARSDWAVGERARVTTLLKPPPRTAEDCENAAAALLEDTVQSAVVGTYTCLSDFLPNGTASDPLPGDAVELSVASGTAGAIIRIGPSGSVAIRTDPTLFGFAFLRVLRALRGLRVSA